ncbi:type II CAAX prenyl endopeptidase Rce1 family protein [Georgenia sp. SYP-B2076]|uniref:CPBP family glutamic-type intramembrane protease n=1 Tax=Georgenia sp. SYP-B2076 TaxID=2495881 RepID=UPI001F0BF21C|nr:CPBP family glutamic-type intramembrane protease [Georgenia sp. SYP-B2076]
MTIQVPERSSAPTARRKELTVRSLGTYFLATFGLSWGAGMFYVFFQEQVDAVLWPMAYTNPVFIFMVYSPCMVGVFMVTRHYGLRGLGPFFRRFVLWRMSQAWWVLLVVGMPAVFYAGAAVNGILTDPFPFTPWYTVLPALLPMLLIGPIEELGWRGLALPLPLPLLQRRLAPLWASLLLGLAVAFWHTPSFLLSGTSSLPGTSGRSSSASSRSASSLRPCSTPPGAACWSPSCSTRR